MARVEAERLHLEVPIGVQVVLHGLHQPRTSVQVVHRDENAARERSPTSVDRGARHCLQCVLESDQKCNLTNCNGLQYVSGYSLLGATGFYGGLI